MSKFLSLVLRHKPETINIKLDEQGWTNVQRLIQALKENNHPISFDQLKHIVNTNNKSRFAFNEDRTKIRANQGHSVDVELGYEAKKPPETLYHGTAERFLGSIMQTGLQKRSRHHVHLSSNRETATAVGQRYGTPVVLIIRALDMFNEGHVFYCSENGVWLTEHVPVKYILQPE